MYFFYVTLERGAQMSAEILSKVDLNSNTQTHTHLSVWAAAHIRSRLLRLSGFEHCWKHLG